MIYRWYTVLVFSIKLYIKKYIIKRTYLLDILLISLEIGSFGY